MFKFGIVTSVETATCRARVKFPDTDEVETFWLPVLQKKTLKDQAYWMPDIDEHVVCLMDEHGENGVILGAIYSEADVPPADDPDLHLTIYSDGAFKKYSRNTHEWDLDVPDEGKIHIHLGQATVDITDGQIVIKANDGQVITMTSDGIVVKASKVQLLSNGASENLVLGNAFKTLFNGHTHTSAAPGAPTSPPLQPMGAGHLSQESFTQ